MRAGFVLTLLEPLAMSPLTINYNRHRQWASVDAMGRCMRAVNRILGGEGGVNPAILGLERRKPMQAVTEEDRRKEVRALLDQIQAHPERDWSAARRRIATLNHLIAQEHAG